MIFTTFSSENQELRNIAAALKKKLHSFCNEASPTIQPPQLKQNEKKNNKAELLTFLQATSDRINNIESNLSQNPIAKPLQNKKTLKSREIKEDHIHCLEQEIHKLEMEKLDILKQNQQCISQFHLSLI